MSWNLKEIYKALNKKFNHTENIEFQKISIDSRKISSKIILLEIGNDFFNIAVAKLVKNQLQINNVFRKI